MRSVVVIIVCLVVLGCQQTRPFQSRSDNAASAHFRIRNSSRTDFLDVRFQGNEFGDMKQGCFSDYQIPVSSSWDISVKLPGATNRMQYVYVDTPGLFFSMSGGWFTCVLTVHDDYGGRGQYLEVDVKKDE